MSSPLPDSMLLSGKSQAGKIDPRSPGEQSRHTVDSSPKPNFAALAMNRSTRGQKPFVSRWITGNLGAFTSDRSADSVEDDPHSIYNIGLVEQLAIDNFLSMRWMHKQDERNIQRNPCGFFWSLMMTSFFVILYFMLFTSIAEREYFTLDRNAIREFLEEFEDDSKIVIFSSVGLFVLVFILDLHNGTSLQKRLSALLYLVSGIGILSTVSFVTRTLVVVPHIVFSISIPIVMALIKYLFFKKMDTLQYILGLVIPLWVGLGVSLFIMGITVPDYRWTTPAVRALFFRQAGCKAFEDLEKVIAPELGIADELVGSEEFLTLDTARSRAFNTLLGEAVLEAEFDVEGENCVLRALVLYNGFSIFVATAFVFIWFMVELMRVSYSDRVTRKLSNLSTAFQVFILFFGLVVFAAWVVATVIPGDDVNYSSLLLLFVAVLGGVGAFLCYNVLGVDYLHAQLNRTPIGKRVYQAASSDVVKAAVVYFLSPVYFLWGFFTIPTQFIRRYTFLGKTIEVESEKRRIVIQEVVDVASMVYGWDLGKVLHSCMLIGLIYFVMAIFFGRFTTVILAVFRVVLEGAPLAVASIVFVIVGLLMFLLPPVPGLPVYLFGGVIVFGNAEPEFGLVKALVFATIVNFLLKLLAVAAEQKIIGEHFGSNSVTIKSMVGVNDDSLKAIRYILKSRGNYVAKVAILCGGPDWPTSVLTGILKLPLLPMLLGTFPVIILVAFATAAGAFLVFTGGSVCLIEGVELEDCDPDQIEPDELIASVRGLLLGLMIIIQAVLFLLAFHCIGKVVDTKPEEIENIPDDLDVIEYERANKKKKERIKELRSWDNLTKKYKVLHVGAVATMIMANWGMQLGAATAFEVIEPTDEPRNPLKPLGILLFGVISVPITYFFVFNKVISNKYKAEQNN